MGTKNTPGQFDCYANAAPDEPMFVLLGRDPTAALVVRYWCELRRELGEDPAKVHEAERCASAMAAWARGLGKQQKIARSFTAARKVRTPQPFVQPTMDCPRCGTTYDDFDGLGVVFCDACGFCRHVTWSGDWPGGGRPEMVCDFCGARRPAREADGGAA